MIGEAQVVDDGLGRVAGQSRASPPSSRRCRAGAAPRRPRQTQVSDSRLRRTTSSDEPPPSRPPPPARERSRCRPPSAPRGADVAEAVDRERNREQQDERASGEDRRRDDEQSHQDAGGAARRRARRRAAVSALRMPCRTSRAPPSARSTPTRTSGSSAAPRGARSASTALIRTTIGRAARAGGRRPAGNSRESLIGARSRSLRRGG